MTLMDGFGLLAVTMMLVFYALERRHTIYVLAFAGACAMGSIYGFLQGAWPFGLIEAIWCLVAVKRWKGLSRTVAGA
jgi:hypothetical protein